MIVNSVHEPGVDRLGAGLSLEAISSEGGVVETSAAKPCGGAVMTVPWHPESDAARCPPIRAFTSMRYTLRDAQASTYAA